MKYLIDLSGQRFGKLTAEEYLGKGLWRCRCDCGGTSTCLTSNLRKGNSTSCGCYRIKHGLSHTPTHHVWREMRNRCTNPKNRAYANYGGRGITVCSEWSDFARFVEDMGLRPEGHQLDRIDNNSGYSPTNCRWVLQQENLNNKRTNRILEFRGERLTIAQWAHALGFSYRTLNNRINRGWPVERALTEAIGFSLKG